MPRLSLIAVVGTDLGIGREQHLLWHLPEDLRHFRALTLGKVVVMGSRTWESLPRAFQPLPGRQNIVLSRDRSYAAPGAAVASSIEEALRLAADAAEVFVIGGAEVYAQTIGRARQLHLTEVREQRAADRFFPVISGSEWREVSRQSGGRATAERRIDEPGFDFVVYERCGPADSGQGGDGGER